MAHTRGERGKCTAWGACADDFLSEEGECTSGREKLIHSRVEKV